MNITEAARVSGLAAKTIRYYEDIGLASPRRGANGDRQFRPDDIRRLIFLGRARRLDFSPQDCRDLLALTKDADRSSANVRKIASRHLAHVDARLTELLQLRDALQNLVDSSAGDRQPDCIILDALTMDHRNPNSR